MVLTVGTEAALRASADVLIGRVKASTAILAGRRQAFVEVDARHAVPGVTGQTGAGARSGRVGAESRPRAPAVGHLALVHVAASKGTVVDVATRARKAKGTARTVHAGTQHVAPSARNGALVHIWGNIAQQR